MEMGPPVTVLASDHQMHSNNSNFIELKNANPEYVKSLDAAYTARQAKLRQEQQQDREWERSQTSTFPVSAGYTWGGDMSAKDSTTTTGFSDAGNVSSSAGATPATAHSTRTHSDREGQASFSGDCDGDWENSDDERSIATSMFVEVASVDDDGSYIGYGADTPSESEIDLEDEDQQEGSLVSAHGTGWGMCYILYVLQHELGSARTGREAHNNLTRV